VIFGKRRAYQRKAAIVDFDGICSAHAFVFRSNPKVIDPKLFPFFLHSDQFMHRMVDISVGGLSPTINWGDLKDQEFLLPPKDKQARLAELLWTMDKVIECERETQLCIRKYLDSVSGRLFSRKVKTFENVLPFDISSESWEEFSLDEVCELITDGAHASPKTVENGYPIGTVENMLEERIDVPSCRTIGLEDFDALKRNNCRPLIGDVLFSKDGTIGKTFVFNQPEDLILLSSIAIIRTKKEVLTPEYCSLMFGSPVFITEIDKRKSGTALKRVVLKDIKKFKINLPSIEFQKEIVEYLKSLKSNILKLDSKITGSRALQESLINQIF
jgi:restriction endonuclease S subunit